MAEPLVVDTNVGVVANGLGGLSNACQLACVELLRAITRAGHLVLDAGDLVYDEYHTNMSLAGQPGVGDLFMKWVHDNRHNEDLCTRLPLTRCPGDAEDYEEFPRDPGLASFDPADRKFVALAASHPEKPPICAASDRGWRNHEAVLSALGIRLRWLDPDT